MKTNNLDKWLILNHFFLSSILVLTIVQYLKWTHNYYQGVSWYQIFVVRQIFYLTETEIDFFNLNCQSMIEY